MAKSKTELTVRDDIVLGSNELLHAIARDVSEEIVDYIRRMYPEAVSASKRSFCLSLRNSIHNQIVSVVRDKKYVGDLENGTLREAQSPQEWLEWRRFQRKRLRALWKKATRKSDESQQIR